MTRFRDIKTLREFTAVPASIRNHFNPNAISPAATISNGTGPLPSPSGVGSQPESPRLKVPQVRISCFDNATSVFSARGELPRPATNR